MTEGFPGTFCSLPFPCSLLFPTLTVGVDLQPAVGEVIGCGYGVGIGTA